MKRIYIFILVLAAVTAINRNFGEGVPPDAPTPSARHTSLKPQKKAEVVLQRARDGHFYVEVDVNGSSVRMVADTGASVIALSAADAERANARVGKVEAGKMIVEELTEDGTVKATHELPFKYSMLLPAFRGVPAIMGLEGLVNPRGFVIVDKHQRNPTYPNVFGIGVAVAIPPTGKTPVPVGVPKTGFMYRVHGYCHG